MSVNRVDFLRVIFQSGVSVLLLGLAAVNFWVFAAEEKDDDVPTPDALQQEIAKP